MAHFSKILYIKHQFLEFIFHYHYSYLNEKFKECFSIFGPKLRKLEKNAQKMSAQFCAHFQREILICLTQKFYT